LSNKFFVMMETNAQPILAMQTRVTASTLQSTVTTTMLAPLTLAIFQVESAYMSAKFATTTMFALLIAVILAQETAYTLIFLLN